MSEEVKKFKEVETADEKAQRKSRAYRNRFIVVFSVNILLVAIIVFQVIWFFTR